MQGIPNAWAQELPAARSRSLDSPPDIPEGVKMKGPKEWIGTLVDHATGNCLTAMVTGQVFFLPQGPEYEQSVQYDPATKRIKVLSYQDAFQKDQHARCITAPKSGLNLNMDKKCSHDPANQEWFSDAQGRIHLQDNSTMCIGRTPSTMARAQMVSCDDDLVVTFYFDRPTSAPTFSPSSTPTQPTAAPSAAPSSAPTESAKPSSVPSAAPTRKPSSAPSAAPSHTDVEREFKLTSNTNFSMYQMSGKVLNEQEFLKAKEDPDAYVLEQAIYEKALVTKPYDDACRKEFGDAAYQAKWHDVTDETDPYHNELKRMLNGTLAFMSGGLFVEFGNETLKDAGNLVVASFFPRTESGRFGDCPYKNWQCFTEYVGNESTMEAPVLCKAPVLEPPVVDTVESLPPQTKPAKELVKVAEMEKSPQGLVSGSGVCTTINDDLVFVAVDCSTQGSVELIYIKATMQLKLVKKEHHGRLLAQSNKGDLCLSNEGAIAKFSECKTDPAFQWTNESPGRLKSEADSQCLDMPDPSAASQLKVSLCDDTKPSQTWKFQIKAAMTASSSGDPHFKTWSGTKYDFHGGCDLVLIQNKGFANDLGLDIHIRTRIKTWWSHISQAVVRIGSDTLDVMGGDDGGSFWMNGAPGDELKEGAKLSLSGYPIVVRSISSKQKRFRIDLGNGEAVAIETYNDFVRVQVNAKNDSNFAGATGMMGSYPNGQMMARDGMTVMEDANAFGKEWQVLASEPMLFHSRGEGVHHPVMCTMPDKSTKNLRRRLEGSMLTEEAAAIACAHVDDDDKDACIFDVLATQDKDLAGSY